MFGLKSSHLMNPRINHGFFTKHGPSLKENDEHGTQGLQNWFSTPIEQIITCKQVHESNVCLITKDTNLHELGTMPADAIVTNCAKIAIGIRTADCLPILFADPYQGVIGATHAGWRGAVAQIIENTIATMIILGADPKRMICAIGPCIAQESYTVSTDLFDQVSNKEFFKPIENPSNPSWLFDLPGYATAKIKNLGVNHVAPPPANTYSNPDLFHSYRRHRLAPYEGYQSQFSFIMLES